MFLEIYVKVLCQAYVQQLNFIMKWYGPNKFFTLSDTRNYKKRFNLKTRSLSLSLKSAVNYNFFIIYFYLPTNWNSVVFKLSTELGEHLSCYLYSSIYFFYFSSPTKFLKFNYDKYTSVLIFTFINKNNFYNIYWLFLKNIFLSFNSCFFKKLKFKGKGYYIFKNYRQTIAMQFGYSHIRRVYSYFLSVKFLSKTAILLYGINRNDIFKVGFTLRQIRPVNIFTGKGIKFTRQIIYKKIGKVSSYR